MKFTFLQVKEIMKKDKDTSAISLVQTRDFIFENFSLVNCLAHRMNKKELVDLALKMMFHLVCILIIDILEEIMI